MRASLSLMLLVTLAAVSTAQSLNSSAPDVTVTNFDWKYAGYQRAETVSDYDPLPGKGGPSSYKIKRSTLYVFKYTAKASLKNTGAKTIKAVSWDYVFTDPESRKEIRRFKIQSRQQILPGENQDLAKDIGLDPKENARPLSKAKQAVELTKIEYTDGSVWRR